MRQVLRSWVSDMCCWCDTGHFVRSLIGGDQRHSSICHSAHAFHRGGVQRKQSRGHGRDADCDWCDEQLCLFCSLPFVTAPFGIRAFTPAHTNFGVSMSDPLSITYQDRATQQTVCTSITILLDEQPFPCVPVLKGVDKLVITPTLPGGMRFSTKRARSAVRFRNLSLACIGTTIPDTIFFRAALRPTTEDP